MLKLREKTLTVAALGLILISVLVTCDSRPPQSPFKSPCGTRDQVVDQVSAPLQTLLNIIYGRHPVPNNDVETLAVCDTLNATDKGLRKLGKDCLTGLHKTIISSTASAIKRIRVNECKDPASRAKIRSAIECCQKRRQVNQQLFDKVTAMMQGVRDMQGVSGEAKLLKSCCVLNHMDKEIDKEVTSFCPKDAPTILGILRTILQDARSTLCRSPKCQGVLESVSDVKYQPPQKFIDAFVGIVLDVKFD